MSTDGKASSLCSCMSNPSMIQVNDLRSRHDTDGSIIHVLFAPCPERPSILRNSCRQSPTSALAGAADVLFGELDHAMQAFRLDALFVQILTEGAFL